MNTITSVLVVYDHAVEKGYLAEHEGMLFLEDVQEGFEKDGLGADADLAVFMSVVNALAKAPSLTELGDMLRKAAAFA